MFYILPARKAEGWSLLSCPAGELIHYADTRAQLFNILWRLPDYYIGFIESFGKTLGFPLEQVAQPKGNLRCCCCCYFTKMFSCSLHFSVFSCSFPWLILKALRVGVTSAEAGVRVWGKRGGQKGSSHSLCHSRQQAHLCLWVHLGPWVLKADMPQT